MTCDVELTDLLPHLASVLVETVDAGEGLVRNTVRTLDAVPVHCPACGQSSDWEHSRYVHHVADEAIGGKRVAIDLSVRRLDCENSGCAKTTFVEQDEGPTKRYQQGLRRCGGSSRLSRWSWRARPLPGCCRCCTRPCPRLRCLTV
ncbi:transposase family protein [Streptomyces sp. NPDC127072]|uniref:transposase family protein n=1 Tax=Streptomyces sp. NPDC127072 TaxID=3347129 RepID=UPI00365C41B2